MKLRKGDFAVFAIAIAAALLLYFILHFNNRSANTVMIYENGVLVTTKSLLIDAEIKLAGNTVEIKNGQVFMKDADCKDKICVKHQPISNVGSIICLPNQVIIKTTGFGDVDVVVGG